MALDTLKTDGNTIRPSLICFSHLRWDSVFQRPHHVMSRFALERPVFFFEEPEPTEDALPSLRLRICPRTNVRVVTPLLPEGTKPGTLSRLLDDLLRQTGPASAWYYTPMARAFSDHVAWRTVVFDCMDDLAAFRFAPPEMARLEQDLMQAARVVFTGGTSLYEARRHRHSNIHCLPSGVDIAHFMTARDVLPDPEDQRRIPRPILGYFGVIDERLDMRLLAEMAALRPDWSFVLVGPVAKLRPEELPKAANIHLLGARDYTMLPAYLAQWDVALMPFAINEATRYISPTKAPEYLAGGRRVVSTRIADVVRRFEGMSAVAIADDAASSVAACEAAMQRCDISDFTEVDDLLATISWDGIQGRMATLLAQAEAPRLVCPAMRTDRAPIADTLVVGAGFAGSVMAERLASAGQRVMVVDRRPHIAGNAFDEHDAAGLLVHRYGPHIFHTNSDEVFRYLSRFTAWRPYEHRVLAQLGAAHVPMPINRTTLNHIFQTSLTDDAETEAFLRSLAERVEHVSSARDFVVASVGTVLYEMLFRGYSLKQWGVDPAALDKSVTARVPARTNDDDRYFTDTYQALPLHGYTRMFENMLDHRNITVVTGVDYNDLPRGAAPHTVFTGPVDAYFGHRYGKLPYRSLVFEHETLPSAFVQPVGTINYPGLDTPYTRCTEFKHLTGQVHAMTSICRERSSDTGEPYYPVPNPANRALYKTYEALADAEQNVTFLGRLGTYRYLNMDQVVGQALAAARRLLAPASVTTAAAAE